MRRAKVFIGLLIILLISGFVIAQNVSDEEEIRTEDYFVIESELGRALPRKIVYDPNFERYLVVDAYGRLFLSNALTFETEHVLYQFGEYNDIVFNRDGTLAAVAIERRIELWDTDTGEMVARLSELGQPLQIVGPITFSRDDRYLIFEGVYPAPRSIRVAENQTINVPWIWHIPSAFETNTSQFPQRAEAWQFFDYRNGMVIAPDNRLIAALPARLQVLDIDTLEVLFDIPTERYERDPMDVWFSARDNQIYIRPVNANSLIQVDTQRGALVEIPLDKALTVSDLELIGSIELSAQAQIIGGSLTDLKGRFLPSDRETRNRTYGSGELTVSLIDLIVPPISEGDNIQALIFIFNEDTQTGFFRLTSGGSQQAILSPDGNDIIMRLSQGVSNNSEETIATYNLDSGELLRQFIPSLRGIGGYRRVSRNRVLAFNAVGDVLVSDFQRYSADTNQVLAEDLRYSRSFDRFFFSDDSQNMITLSGSEWRVWDANTGEVLRREVISFRGSIVSTNSDGYRYLVSRRRFNTDPSSENGREVIDLYNGQINREEVFFDEIDGHTISGIYHSPDWRRFLVVYSVNSYGDYAPGNQIAMYEMGVGFRWLIAGDDLPPAEGREYGWVDNNQVYIRGSGYADNQPARIFGVEYDESRLPDCVVERFPEQVDVWLQLWERQLYGQRPDKLHQLSELICASEITSRQNMTQLLLPTPTPNFITPTPPPELEGVPYCLLLRYPDDIDSYAAVWRETIEGLSPEQINEAEQLLCQGIGVIPTPHPQSPEQIQETQYLEQTMIIDAVTGVRSSGSFQPVEVIRRPVQPVIQIFERIFKRSMGQAILSPDAQLIAASSLPGELIIYRIVIGYDTIMADVTATAVAIQQAQNLIYPLPSSTPMFNLIGTARPTLTPTPLPTEFPRPQTQLEQEHAGEILELCPSEQLYTTSNLPEGYSPTGSIIAPVQGDTLWRVNPITGQRAPDETVPQCGTQIDCSFSVDRTWILARTIDELYVIRPDGTDFRLLAGEDDPKPQVYWAAPNILEENVSVYLQDERRYANGIQQDILGVFPDPDPIILEGEINELPIEIMSRQPGGKWILARIPFRTGTNYIYQYYLYNLETSESVYFARSETFFSEWHPLGDRFFFKFDSRQTTEWYQISMDNLQARRLPDGLFTGTWSPDGRYTVLNNPDTRSQRAFPVVVWDTMTGLQRRYCVPETGARLYNGGYRWSPDNRYVALLAPLPKDEAREGVGQHLLILDIETGTMVDLTNGTSFPISWIAESYE